MEMEVFEKQYPELTARGGVYAIRNSDSRRRPFHVKVGSAMPFKSRFGFGDRGGGYSTLVPKGLKVEGVLVVPNAKHYDASGKMQTRIKKRELEAHLRLSLAPGIKRTRRGSNRGRHVTFGSTEWFRPLHGAGDQKFVDQVVLSGLENIARSHQDSLMYKCNRFECKRKRFVRI